jgi:hypothetical protein
MLVSGLWLLSGNISANTDAHSAAEDALYQPILIGDPQINYSGITLRNVGTARMQSFPIALKRNEDAAVCGLEGCKRPPAQEKAQ